MFIFLFVGLTPHLTSPARGEEPNCETLERMKQDWVWQCGSSPFAGEGR